MFTLPELGYKGNNATNNKKIEVNWNTSDISTSLQNGKIRATNQPFPRIDRW